MRKIKEHKVLLIPDIHQDIDFANRCLDRDFDHVVFMGDYMDSRAKKGQVDNRRIYSKQNALKWISNKRKELGNKATWLIGNHDLSYLTCYVDKSALRKVTEHWANWNCICSGFSRKGAANFNKSVDEDWLFSLELAAKVGDFTVSHAGFHPAQFPNSKDVKKSIKKAVLEWRGDRAGGFLREESPWISWCGKARGGKQVVGSPIWLDFWEEFQPIDGINQVVGHTRCPHFFAQHKHAKHSQNFCIDHSQQGCAIIEDGATIEHIQIYR